MNNFYLTDKLEFHVLNPNDCKLVLNFLKANIPYFEPYEAKKNDTFYTEAFQYDTLLAESSFFMQKRFIRYYIFLKNVSDPVGTVSFKKVSEADSGTMMLGYKVDHRFWRMGIAYESISFLSGLIFGEHIADRLEAAVHPDNIQSIRLLKKLGFSHDPGNTKKYELASGFVIHDIYHLMPYIPTCR